MSWNLRATAKDAVCRSSHHTPQAYSIP